MRAILILLLLAGCTAMPLREGDRARLLPGYDEPRSRDSIPIEVHEGTLGETIRACALLRARKQPALAALLIATGSITYSCAHVKRKSCTVYVVEGWKSTLEHELRHCEGWDHPA